MKEVRHWIRMHRRNVALSSLASCAEKYLRAWNNEGFYEFSRNGEQFAFDMFVRWWGNKPLTIWDVGANKGGWVLVAHQEAPNADIISFEMIPPVYAELIKRVGEHQWFKPVCAGLSDRECTMEATFNPRHHTTSSLTPRLGLSIFDNDEVSTIPCAIITGDGFAVHNSAPHFLKIDTEGHEISVLRGCEKLLSGSDAPFMIQFEYGTTYIPGGSTLKQAYDILTPFGYRIGRLFPRHVEFRDYDYDREDFRMGNFIATRSDELVRLLS